MVEPVHETDIGKLPPFLQRNPITSWMEDKGWSYHPHQIQTLQQVRLGKDVLLFAPTGAGKTLAGFLPSLIDLVESPQTDQHKLHTLYISPLKALATDVARNVAKPIQELDLPISYETRTGDTPASKRQRQKNKPPDMLMTTPESLALLLSYEEASTYFQHLKTIIIDEVHALMHSKRGDLLCLNLARLNNLAPQAMRIGLSATVEDPATARDYLCRPENSTIISVDQPVKPSIEIMLGSRRMPWSGHMATYAIEDIYARLKNTGMSVVFVNTRAQAELIFQELWKINEDNLRIAVHHGSLEKELRCRVEQKMAKGELDCVVATSALDLGLDWAEVDLVMQIGAPKGAARLLQRIGRSNHRLNEPSQAVLVPANRFEYLECLAAKAAIDQGVLDGPLPKKGSLDVLAQHILGTACSAPIDLTALYKEVIQAWPYRDLNSETFHRVVEFVRTGGYALKNYERYARLVQDSNGYFTLPHRDVFKQYRMNIGTIVESPMVAVKLKLKSLGKIEEGFIANLSSGDTFLFGGEVLKFEGLSAQGAQVSRTKDKCPQIPSYAGGRMPLSSHLAQSVRYMMQDPESWQHYPDTVREWLETQKDQSVMPEGDGLLIETFPRGGQYYLVAYPFEGWNAHKTLGFLVMRRMQRLGYRPLGFVATDYAIALWSLKPVEQVEYLVDQDLMADDLEEWLRQTPLLKRNFRDCATIAGLIERRFPGAEKSGRQMTFSSDLIYDVLHKYEPDHILLQAAYQDAAHGLIDLRRLSAMLQRVAGKVTHQVLDKVSPLAVPMILEVSRESPGKDDKGDFLLEDLEEALLKEAGIQ